MSSAAYVQDPETVAPVQVLSGYGLDVGIKAGHLVARDGVGANQRHRRFSRLAGLKRIVVLGDSGSVSLDALRWLHDVGAAFVHIGVDATVVTVAPSNTLNDVRVRRGQALATFTTTGVMVSRKLLTAKLTGQLEVLRRLRNSATAQREVEHALQALKHGQDIAVLRYAESRAAAAYWTAWRDVEVRFVGRDASRVPAHWRSVGARRSVLTDGPRKAVAPFHALLNYAYAVLEAEAHLAAVAVGCDPELGVIHADRVGRSSFACDLMEPIRPHVDAFLLHLLDTRSFLKADFFETREGVCRVMPPLTEALAATGPEWAKRLAPIAESIAGILGNASDMVQAIPTSGGRADTRTTAQSYRTPLTQRNRTKKRSEQRWDDRGVASALTAPLPARCKECGTEVPKRRALCDACLKTLPTRAAARAIQVQSELRAAGADKRSTAETRERHRTNAARQASEIAAWKVANPATPNPQIFTREIWPLLRDVPVAALVEATGLSTAMCKNVRSGKQVPHPRHWDKFRRAAAAK